MYFPLARITNINNIAAATAAGGSVTAPGYSAKPVDCQYAATVATTSASTGAP